MGEILNEGIRTQLIIHAATEVVRLRKAELTLLTEGQEEYSADLEAVHHSRIGWGAFLSEMASVGILNEVDIIPEKQVMIEDRIEATERYRERRENDQGLIDMYDIDLIQLHAQKKALLVATGQMNSQLILELDSATSDDLYVAVDWTGDWNSRRRVRTTTELQFEERNN